VERELPHDTLLTCFYPGVTSLRYKIKDGGGKRSRYGTERSKSFERACEGPV